MIAAMVFGAFGAFIVLVMLAVLRWNKYARLGYSAAFKVTLPCPRCHERNVIGYRIVSRDRSEVNAGAPTPQADYVGTRYVCKTFGCDWSDWTVPDA